MIVLTQSKRFAFNKVDLLKVGRGAVLAGGGAVVVYLLEVVPQVDFGVSFTPLVTAFAAILLNAARKWLSGK